MNALGDKHSPESSFSIDLTWIEAKGLAIFEDANKFNRWLQKENPALSGKKPIQMLNNLTGIKLVNQILDRIEEGIYT